ncbi:MAG: PA14 domain-containing protein [Proteobacteria bacterium]|nr:PA14 domain-containing protein [Pseudomonadota bacterium]
MSDNLLKSGILKGVTAVALSVGVLTFSTIASAETITGLKAASPQPNAGELKPGLAVQYYSAEMNNLRELDDWMGFKDGKPGKPLPMLNYQVGDGNVLTSESSDFVGANIQGYIKMDKPGRYTFLVHSNDGVYVSIGDKLIYEDPTVHADSFSDELVLEVSDPGWYPIHIKYFEKKNTSTLELYWEPPGGPEMDYVPAEAFAHMKE